MITGDHKDTAVAIAEELRGMKGPIRSLSGMELDRLSDDELIRTVDQVAVYARVSAEHKLRIVKAWQARGAIVAMTGDGVERRTRSQSGGYRRGHGSDWNRCDEGSCRYGGDGRQSLPQSPRRWKKDVVSSTISARPSIFSCRAMSARCL